MPSAAQRNNRLGSSRLKSKNGPRLTCVHCRTRKIKCDGALPGCGICAAYGKDCSYEKPPSMAQVVAMAERIQELERTIQELPSSPSRRVSAARDTPSGTQIDGRVPSASDGEDQSMSLRQPQPYYESTSAIDAPRNVRSNELPSTAGEVPSQESIHNDFSQSRTDLGWEENAIENCSIFLQLPPEKVRHLLATHWAWVHPTFMFVNRSMFLRDAAIGGEYFSALLLTIICLHSTRFTDQALNERLFSYAKMLIGHELHDDPTIPRVQAFLQLSAREIGRGSISQAWMYSGIAFRMAIDMGLFNMTAQQNDSGENVDKRRIGHKLAWSCYLWDKAMSLYLGRSPSLQHEPAWLPDDCPSLHDEHDWNPYGVTTKSPTYRMTPSRIETCFQNFCKLGVIICDILLNLYGQQTTQNPSLFVRSTRDKLDAWYQDLPDALQMGIHPPICTNPQILTQNLLYRATTILLLRPFRKIAVCRTGCRDAANAIENLFLCMERTFGFTRVTYLMAYCAYIAATVVVQDAQDQVPGAQRSVDTFVRVLSALCYSCPGIQRSLDIIKQSMPASSSRISPLPEASQPAVLEANFDIFDSMPTFPLNCSSLGLNPSMPAMAMPFTELDPFTYQWSNFHEDMLDTMNFQI